MEDTINFFKKYTGKGYDDFVAEAMADIQDDLVEQLIDRLIEIVEKEATIEHDENEDGKFTTVVIDTPNTRELLKDMILDNYRLETK